jgi:gephyrin
MIHTVLSLQGEHDLIKPLLEELGTVHFGRLFMKPGKPTTFATVVDSHGKTKLAFALPGNPVSSFTTCHLLVHPVLKKLRGLPEAQCHHTKVHAVLTHPVKLDAERPEFHRATVSWDIGSQQFIATSTGIQMSSRLLRYKTNKVGSLGQKLIACVCAIPSVAAMQMRC